MNLAVVPTRPEEEETMYEPAGTLLTVAVQFEIPPVELVAQLSENKPLIVTVEFEG